VPQRRGVFEALAKMMDLAKNSLEIKRKVLERFTEQDFILTQSSI